MRSIIAWGGIWSRIEILTGEGTSLHPKGPMNDLITHYPPRTSIEIQSAQCGFGGLAMIIHPPTGEKQWWFPVFGIWYPKILQDLAFIKGIPSQINSHQLSLVLNIPLSKSEFLHMPGDNCWITSHYTRLPLILRLRLSVFVAAVAVTSHFAWHQGAGEMNATNLWKVGYGWMTWRC